jgi:hypothetical protein
MPASMMSADTGSRYTVTGSRIATPVVPPTPGSTPISRPSTVPRRRNARRPGVASCSNPMDRKPRLSSIAVAT